MFNPAILVAVIAQALISRFSRLAGALVGLLLTTGILVWGLSVYSAGGQIALLSIPLSQPVFILACLAWYAFDSWELVRAWRAAAALKEVLAGPLMRDPGVLAFYDATLDAWSSGRLDALGPRFRTEGDVGRDELVRKYPPLPGTALDAFFELFEARPGEFLVGLGNHPTAKEPGWFVLTNLRLLQRDGATGDWWDVGLADVASLDCAGQGKKTLTFQMKSGEIVSLTGVDVYPKEKLLQDMIARHAELAGTVPPPLASEG